MTDAADPGPPTRHTAALSPIVAGVSDIGLIHRINEDAMALAAGPDWCALIVCDGVSSSRDSEVAARAAADGALEVLAVAPRPAGLDVSARVAHWSSQLCAAGRAAASGAAQAVPAVLENPPACTFVAAVADADLLIVAWLGDSRAYWLPDEGAAEQLTVDDSWASQQQVLGVSREVAEAGPYAHAITRWLGRSSPPGDASTASTVTTSPGWLVVCSDGLWNYCSDAADLSDVVASRSGSADAPAEVLAAGLADWAIAQGGHDNITVTLARITPPGPTTGPGQASGGADVSR